MTRTLTTAIATLSAVGIVMTTATVALAHGDRDRGHRGLGKDFSFEEIDANGDQMISVEEVKAWRDAQFAEADADGDGAISQEEFEAAAQRKMEEMMSQRSARMFGWLDKNDDGALTPDEVDYSERIEKMIDRLDSDDDGMVSMEELEDRKSKRGGWGKHGRHGEGK